MSIWHTHPTIDKIEVSTDGRIRSAKTKKLYTPIVAGKGYLSVHIRNKNNKRFYVHRLVAETFIPNPENKPQVNHKNGIKTDNCADNLEWASCKENINHAIETGLNTQDYKNKPVLCITNRKIYKSCRHTARALGIGFSQIQGACSGRYKQTHGFQFRFLDDLLALETELERTRKALDVLQEFVTKLYLNGNITDEQLHWLKKNQPKRRIRWTQTIHQTKQCGMRYGNSQNQQKSRE